MISVEEGKLISKLDSKKGLYNGGSQSCNNFIDRADLKYMYGVKYRIQLIVIFSTTQGGKIVIITIFVSNNN